jgi:hypothetical protein
MQTCSPESRKASAKESKKASAKEAEARCGSWKVNAGVLPDPVISPIAPRAPSKSELRNKKVVRGKVAWAPIQRGYAPDMQEDWRRTVERNYLRARLAFNLAQVHPRSDGVTVLVPVLLSEPTAYRSLTNRRLLPI